MTLVEDYLMISSAHSSSLEDDCRKMALDGGIHHSTDDSASNCCGFSVGYYKEFKFYPPNVLDYSSDDDKGAPIDHNSH